MKALTFLAIALAVTGVWLGCLGFLRLRRSLDALHCVTFCTIFAGCLIMLACFLADGLSDRSLKVLLIWIFGIVSGAATSHASGRAIVVRGENK